MSGIQMMVLNSVQPTEAAVPSPILYLDATDYSGSGATWPAETGSDATLINAPAYTAAAPTFFTFNGTDETATTANLKANFSSSNSQTLEIWARTVSDDGVVISQHGTSTINTFYHLSVMEIVSGDLKVGLWQDPGSIGNVTVGAVTRNQWQQYVLTYDDATNTLTGYIDADVTASTTLENSPPTPGWFYSLCATDSTNMGNGSYLGADVGLFRVWDIALTADQVDQIYQQNTARFNNPVTANLVLNLDAADYSGSGDWLDTSGNSNDAALQGTPAWNAADGGYFDLVPAQGDWFSIADAASLDSMSEITIETWINLDTVNAAGPNMLFSKRGTVNDGYVGFLQTTGYTYRFGTGTGTGLTYSTAPTTGAWQQVVATIGSGGSVLYINGTSVTTSVYTGTPANVPQAAPLDLYQVNPRPQVGPVTLDGKISIFRIYDAVLSPEQVTQNFNAVRDRYGI